MKASNSSAPKRQFNVQLPPDLIAEIKHASIDEGLTLSEFVESVLRAGLLARTPASSLAS